MMRRRKARDRQHLPAHPRCARADLGSCDYGYSDVFV